MSGNLEDIRVFKQNSDDIEVIMKIDGVVIPNIIVPISFSRRLRKYFALGVLWHLQKVKG